jgi:hypothetical protein
MTVITIAKVSRTTNVQKCEGVIFVPICSLFNDPPFIKSDYIIALNEMMIGE